MDVQPTFRRSSVLDDLAAARVTARSTGFTAEPARAADYYGSAVSAFLVLGAVGVVISGAALAGFVVTVATDGSLYAVERAIWTFVVGAVVMAVSILGAGAATLARSLTR